MSNTQIKFSQRLSVSIKKRNSAVINNGTKDTKGATYKEIIYQKLKFGQDGRCVNTFNLISDPEILKIAYLTIKSKPGNMTKGVNEETLDGISEE